MTDDDDITSKEDDIDDGKRQLRMLRITLYVHMKIMQRMNLI